MTPFTLANGCQCFGSTSLQPSSELSHRVIRSDIYTQYNNSFLTDSFNLRRAKSYVQGLKQAVSGYRDLQLT